MNTSRTARIAGIIEKRRPLAQKIASVEAVLLSLTKALRHLEEHRNQLLAKLENQTATGRLQEIDFLTISFSIAAELEALGKLRVRLARNTLNLGVVGRARQGKSRLLQSLTGLTAAEIPDGDRQHCTGVRSTIHHNPSVETYGEVWFYSERSFLEQVISPYYEKLRLGAKPITLTEFASQPLPSLPSDLPGYAEPGAMYEHLVRYHTHLDKYQPLLEANSPRRIARDEIREYVAQDTPDGRRVFFNYLAVTEVKIVCKFPNSQVGQIALVDMPGLGDTGVGDEERLMRILGQEVDAILFMRMPKSSGDYWADVDVKLYDTARAALVDLPINQWSFMILNRTNSQAKNGDNANNCQDLADTITDKHIRVVECITANCAVPKAANQLLDQVLDYLATNITALDQQYASSCQERLLQLHSSIKAELTKARLALGQATPRDTWFALFVQLFDQLWSELTQGLEGLLRALRQQRNTQDSDFKKQVVMALETCRQDTGIPSIEEIETRRDRVGGYPNAYYQYLNEIRAHLSQHFLSLDDGLKQSIERVKSQVAEVLVEQGHLGKLTDYRGTEFIDQITRQLPETLSRLKLGFTILSEFDLSYRGLIQHRIRRHLDGLTPDEATLTLSQSPCAAEVLANLKTLHAEAIYGCETALEDLLSEPSQAAFAIVEEFVDRVLRAENVKQEWRIFLEEVRGEVWPTEFALLGDRTRRLREWLNSVEEAASTNQLDSMQFLELVGKDLGNFRAT
ncbi:hypothetical protein [Lyngbya aestuarii]|uniref:hypothetical protein n=1 Tax=Lyngbya aestuarii TaxID=118322 RepID=UPI00403E3014